MSALDVAQARFEEARDITDALRDRLRNLRTVQAAEGDVLFVMRKVRTSTMELVEAEDYEAHCWAGYSAVRLDALHAPRATPSRPVRAA
jgi:hypothetical protein